MNMFSQKKIIKILFGIIFIIIAIISGQIWINKGQLIVENINPPFVADFPRYGKITCNLEPCIFNIKPRKYNVTIKKDGFFESSKIIDIKLWEKTKWEAELKKIPVILPLDDLPDDFIVNFYPHPPVGENPYAINKEGEVFFLNLKTGQLFKGVGEGKILISEFENIDNAKIYPSKNFVYLVANNNLYEIDINKKNKYQIYSGNNIENVKSEENAIFIQESGKIYVKLNENSVFEDLPFNTNLELICALDRQNIFAVSYEKTAEKIQTDFVKIDIENSIVNKIIDSIGELVPIKIACKNSNSFLIQLENKEAYKLEF